MAHIEGNMSFGISLNNHKYRYKVSYMYVFVQAHCPRSGDTMPYTPENLNYLPPKKKKYKTPSEIESHPNAPLCKACQGAANGSQTPCTAACNGRGTG